MKRLFSLIKNIRRTLRLSYSLAPKTLVALFILVVVTYLAPLYQAKLLGDIVNKIVAEVSKPGASVLPITLFVLAYAAVWGAIRVAGAFQTYLEKRWHLINENGVDIAILKKRAEIDLGHYESPKFQNLIHRAFDNGNWPLLQLAEAQFQTIANLAVILVSSIITSAISWKLYVVVILTSLPSFWAQLKYGYEVWGIWAEQSDRQRKFYSLRSHLLTRSGVIQTKILQNSPRIISTLENILGSFRKDLFVTDRRRLFTQTGTSVIAAAGFGFALWLITRDVIVGTLSVGAMVFVVSALGQLIGAINSLLSQIATQLEKNLYVTDIFQVLDTKPFIKIADNPIKLKLSTPPIIEFKNVYFKYEGREDWILKDVNLTIKPGEKIALVGMNGAGKSTIVKLLSRIYDPNEGQILINGVDLKEIDINEWTSYLSVLLQDYLTYDLTISESIAMSRTDIDIDKEVVKRAAGLSEAHEFINDWENKYDQQLGKEFEGGIEPSKGQQQKIALARTIYRNSLIMVLDEPTAAIDALSETKIFEAMERAVGQNTLIVITHRFNTTQNMDKIIVLEKGAVAEIGTHKELMILGGLYKEMFDSQAKAFRKDIEE